MDLSQLTQEDIAQLAALIQNSGQRSPIWKPLSDMREPRTQKERLHRPHFEWSADEVPGTVIPPFPRLFWTASGEEKLIATDKDMVNVGADWTPYPPLTARLDTVAQVQAELDSLTPEDRAFVLEAMRKNKLESIQAKMSAMSDREMASLNHKPAEVKAKK